MTLRLLLGSPAGHYFDAESSLITHNRIGITHTKYNRVQYIGGKHTECLQRNPINGRTRPQCPAASEGMMFALASSMLHSIFRSGFDMG
jgi:hypothetical protein